MSSKQFPDYCQLTFEAEGGKLPAVLRPHCPGKQSGVTIGPGYDMKERASAEVVADLTTAGVSASVAEKLSGGVGKQGDAAKAWITANYPGKAAVITAEASASLFTHVYPGYAELVRKKVTELWGASWDDLPVKMKEVLVDLAFRGDVCRFKEGATKHEKLIKPLVVKNDYAGFCTLIQDYRYWQDNANLEDDKNGNPNGRIIARARWLGDGGGATERVSAVSFPFDLGGGAAPTTESTEAHYKHTEIVNKGGYFPVGVNTVWHGGIHLRAPRGTPVRALWDGKLVAARLPDDPAKATQHFGSTNFVLLAHEIGGATLNKMAPKGKLIGYMVRIGHVNLRKTPSLRGDKVAVLDMYDELGLLEDKRVHADGYAWAHVSLQKAKNAGKAANVGKQGYVALQADWYWAMREPSKAPKLDEKKRYHFHSLYMHLNHEALDGSSRALDAVRWLHAPPSAASTETLSASVGQGGANEPEDVRKVQGRLREHQKYTGEATGACDAATIAAIRAFQGDLVKAQAIAAVDGILSPQGRTWAALQQPPRGGSPKLDEGLVGALRKGAVVKLDKPIQGGDVLWTSGDYGSPGHRAALIHWEIFSEENLMPGWTKVEDDDDDFNMDCPEIIKMIQQDDGWWESDEILTLDEIVRFYTKHPGAKLLRSYACKFVSEWGIDLDVAIPKMLDANLVSTYGLRERMAPYLWWKEAAGKKVPLPAQAKCWHYNPISFASALAAAVPARATSAGPQADEQPSTGADDHVFVQRNQQRVPHYSQADAAWGSRTLGSTATITNKGCAISSVAMILKYYGRDVSPLALDQYLDEHDGYSGDSVLWEVAFKCEETEDLKFGSRSTVTSGFKSVLDARIAQNKPTLARVDYAKDADGKYNHFVVIVGRHKDGHYIMNDPATSKGNGASDPSKENLIEKTSRKGGYTLVQLDIVDPV